MDDNGGWGEEDDGWGAAGGSGGDADWGDGNNDDSGWGAGAEDDQGPSAAVDDGDLPVDVQIENAFYEADDARLDRPNEALVMFQRVLELAAQVSPLGDEQVGFVFKSMRSIVSLLYRAGRLDDMRKSYADLLQFIPRVTRNEAQDAVNSVLHEVQDCRDADFVDGVFAQTSDTVMKLGDQERLWFRVNMRRTELAMRRNDVDGAQALVARLLETCRLPDGSDDLSKGAELLELYALDARLSLTAEDAPRLKALYERTKNLQAAVKDPRSQSVIRECWGMMFGDQGAWGRAYAEFYSAFNSYQDVGERERAKQCLKYVVVANMLSGGTSNPFDAREAKAFQADPEVEAISNLRNAYEKCDVERFNNYLGKIQAARDAFVDKHLRAMVREFHVRALLQVSRPFRRVRIDFLASYLRIRPELVEEYLVQMILDGQIAGRIDQIGGVLDLTAQAVTGATYSAIERWSSALARSLNQKDDRAAFFIGEYR